MLKRYTAADKGAWDGFVEAAKNGLFLFYRDYMEYHAGRFEDCSLLAYDGERLVALLPANRKERTLYSHQGLTFGGWITDDAMGAALMLRLFEHLKAWLAAEGLSSLMYKCIPPPYYRAPAQEDIFALFRQQAALMGCEAAAVIDCRAPLPFCDRRKRGMGKAAKAGIAVRESGDYPQYFALLEKLLKEKYHRAPTHSLEELTVLAARFPESIRLFAAYRHEAMVAGVIVYVSSQVARAQYIASNEEGRQCGALDAVFDHLLQHYRHKRYFDFGTSSEADGALNESLMQQKEGFGARTVAQLTFRLEV